MKRKKGFYSISVVAKMFSVHQQTVRMYEKEGLISPKRSDGNTRLFSEEDVDRLEEIIYLTHKMGVNLAGVDMILKLQKKIKKLQEEINGQFSQLQTQLQTETAQYKEELRSSVGRLASLKKEKTTSIIVPEDSILSKNKGEEADTHEKASDFKEESWKIDYDNE